MKKVLLLISFLMLSSALAQTKKVLVYSETNGFRHNGAIDEGIPMIRNQGIQNGLWTTDDSEDSSVFTTSNLEEYDAVVFLNTTGDDQSSNSDLLTASEKQAFEQFIINGGGFVGIHSATDTYRDGSWPFYNELVGAIVQSSPNHTDNNLNATMTIINPHPAVDFLGSVWNKDEEYYYWELNGGQLSNDNTVLLEVESTGSNSYDAPRPIAWFKEAITVNGTTFTNLRSFYTALGHNGSDYSGDAKFQQHIEEAITYVLGDNDPDDPDDPDDHEEPISELKLYPNPIENELIIGFGEVENQASLFLHTIYGKLILEIEISTSNLEEGNYKLDVRTLKSGLYFLSLDMLSETKTFKIVKQ